MLARWTLVYYCKRQVGIPLDVDLASSAVIAKAF